MQAQSRSFSFQGKTHTLNPVPAEDLITNSSSKWKQVFAKMLGEGNHTPQLLDALWQESLNPQSVFYKTFKKLHRDILTPTKFRRPVKK
jgi:hypothetical protein